jgi:hypothetical protein
MSLVIVTLAALGLTTATPARAVPLIPAIDFASIVLGSQAAASLTNNIVDGPLEPDLGRLTGTVWHRAGTYTYELLIDPVVNNLSGFGTSFGVTGFTGVAGYRFADASAAGAPDPEFAFDIIHFDDSDGTLSWLVPAELQDAGFWRDSIHGNNLVPMTLFFQSTAGPGLGIYNLINLHVGSAVNYAPTAAVPEPASLLLLGSGFTVMGILGRLTRRMGPPPKSGARARNRPADVAPA